ncbi:MAG: 3-phosphoshikimate 1-carboxyvinyltransferase [Bacteroidetes bacterium]|nr:3-phosphoshikimate 1-carboxyvinyltransferase [Bacteroidota bacterium]
MSPQQYTIHAPQKPIKAEITLPASKSFANRLLIMRSFNSFMKIDNISDANDTVLLQKLINVMQDKEQGNFSKKETGTIVLDAGPAGTVYRFMTARLAIESGNWILTGSDRMKERPVKLLVDALKTLGADIEYGEKEGFPPLFIKGKKIKGGAVTIDAGVSSQYISALMMIAPALENGLQLTLGGTISSLPYIEMTARLMEETGIKIHRHKNSYHIPPQDYASKQLTVEPDWSAASYWFQMVALNQDAEVLLKGLTPNSLQGDSAVRALFEHIGVTSQFTSEGLLLKHIQDNANLFTADFTDIPDLAQTFAITLAAKGIPSKLKGLRSLRIKETDRITAIINELANAGYQAIERDNFVLEIPQQTQRLSTQPSIPFIHTYHDHRMAMCFAPLVLTGTPLQIENPAVVEKSYPKYWEHLKQAGFLIEG